MPKYLMWVHRFYQHDFDSSIRKDWDDRSEDDVVAFDDQNDEQAQKQAERTQKVEEVRHPKPTSVQVKVWAISHEIK